MSLLIWRPQLSLSIPIFDKVPCDAAAAGPGPQGEGPDLTGRQTWRQKKPGAPDDL